MKEFYTTLLSVSSFCFLVLGITIFFEQPFMQVLRVIFHLALVILVIGLIIWVEERRKRKEHNIWRR